MDANTEFTTHFPSEQVRATVATGDILGFDFHREMHYITQDESKPNGQPRVTLKVHICAYPKSLPWMGRLLAFLSVRYGKSKAITISGTVIVMAYVVMAASSPSSVRYGKSI